LQRTEKAAIQGISTAGKIVESERKRGEEEKKYYPEILRQLMLDWLGTFFVYRSPKPGEGFRNFLPYLSSRTLGNLAGTKTHHSKKKLIEIYFQKEE
jgi:hypothetical protein